MTWRGWFVDRSTDEPVVTLRDDLDDAILDGELGMGEVTVEVSHSSLNYKDALALTGRPGILRVPALIPGIDAVGTVTESSDPAWRVGDAVLVNGCGLSETHHGGLAQRARLRSEWLIPVPAELGAARAAAIGTAGFTAQLSVLELERQASLDGDILVTGATGGVGSIAIALLAARGHRVVAVTGRDAEHERLRELGAAEILDRAELQGGGKPLQSQRWAGAVDAVGGDILANVLAQTRIGGTVAACGNAASGELHTTVFPFILRGVRLSGINSVEIPRELKLEAWRRLAADLDPDALDGLTTTIGLDDALAVAERMIAGEARGRTLVDVHG